MAFQRIEVWQVTKLRTYMTLKEGDEWMRVEQSEDDDRDCYVVKNTDGSTSLYFNSSESNDSSRSDVLADDITIVVQDILKSKLEYRYVRLLIDCIGREDEIGVRLNKMRVPDYLVSQKVRELFAPAPGTYVPVRFHIYLDNMVPFFPENDYSHVVMEWYDPLTDDDYINQGDIELSATYRYVKIIEKTDMDSDILAMYQTYKVDVGELECLTVPAYKLYTILRNENVARGSVEDLETIHGPSETAEHRLYINACKEIRDYLQKSWETPEQRSIMKFLRMKWHPDKCQGQEEMCHRVFVYLQQCIARLENGQPLLEETNGTDQYNMAQEKRASPRYASFFNRMEVRYNLPHGEYQQEKLPFIFSYSELHKREPCPSPEEAQNWKRQANSDLQDAKFSMENYSVACERGIPATNWICYRCHQVIKNDHLKTYILQRYTVEYFEAVYMTTNSISFIRF